MMNNNRHPVFTCFFVAALFILASQIAVAQSMDNGIAVQGSASIEKPAEFMRMSMKIEAKGESYKAAMESLAKKKKKATIKLEKLGAIEDSIQFSEPSTGEQSDSSQMIAQMQRSFGNDPRVASMMKVKPPVAISVNVTADWTLEGSGDELLMACDEQRQEITGVDVGGAKDKVELSEEQQELAEEMKEMMSQYGGRNEKKAGEAEFKYVGRFAPAQIDEITANAISKAKLAAERLARAANLELGTLQRLSTSGNSTAEYYAYEMYGSRGPGAANKTLDDGSLEVTGKSPLSVRFSVTVATVFEIK